MYCTVVALFRPCAKAVGVVECELIQRRWVRRRDGDNGHHDDNRGWWVVMVIVNEGGDGDALAPE